MYYSPVSVEVLAIGDTNIYLNTPLTKIKDGEGGTNHYDLGKGALLQFFCWPKEEVISLLPQGRFIIAPFTAYRVEGKHERNVDHEIAFYISFTISFKYKFATRLALLER